MNQNVAYFILYALMSKRLYIFSARSCGYYSSNQRERTCHLSFETKWIPLSMIRKISKQVSTCNTRDSDMEYRQPAAAIVIPYIGNVSESIR